MTKTFTVVGAGPLTGLATAKRFGKLGFRVALVARRQESLDAMARELEAEGTEARGFAADVGDERSLKTALSQIRAAYGATDVLLYAPYGGLDFVAPSAVTIERVRSHFDVMLGGAVHCVQDMLPDMLKRGEGALLATTGRTAIQAMKMIGASSLVTPGLRGYFYELYDELKSKGIYAGIVTISVLIDKQHADNIADKLLHMYHTHDRIEDVYGEGVGLLQEISAITQKAVKEFQWPEDRPTQ